MILRRPATHPGLRHLGVVLLIVGLLRVPLPQADYHEIRHLHGPGEVCAHHDHLLRWHPEIGRDDSVAVFHWHWFVPTSQDPGRDDDEEGPGLPAGAAALHAHTDGLQPDWPGDLLVQVDERGRFVHHEVTPASPDPRCILAAGSLPLPASGPLERSPRRRACASLHAPLVGLSQQRNC